jgi:hypothetical protein
MKKTIAAVAALAMLAACAQRPGKISATYVSPAIYDGYSCPQLLAERQVILVKVNEIAVDQANKAAGDAVAVGVGVLFSPAYLLLAAGSDKESELASLKGNYDAVTKAALNKKCITQAQIQQEEEAAKAAEKQRRREERRKAESPKI